MAAFCFFVHYCPVLSSQAMFELRSRYQLPDSCRYFFDQVEALTGWRRGREPDQDSFCQRETDRQRHRQSQIKRKENIFVRNIARHARPPFLKLFVLFTVVLVLAVASPLSLVGPRYFPTMTCSMRVFAPQRSSRPPTLLPFPPFLNLFLLFVVVPVLVVVHRYLHHRHHYHHQALVIFLPTTTCSMLVFALQELWKRFLRLAESIFACLMWVDNEMNGKNGKENMRFKSNESMNVWIVVRFFFFLFSFTTHFCSSSSLLF